MPNRVVPQKLSNAFVPVNIGMKAFFAYIGKVLLGGRSWKYISKLRLHNRTRNATEEIRRIFEVPIYAGDN